MPALVPPRLVRWPIPKARERAWETAQSACADELLGVDRGGVAQADDDAFAQLRERHGLEMRPGPEVLERFGLRMGEPLSGGWTPPAL